MLNIKNTLNMILCLLSMVVTDVTGTDQVVPTRTDGQDARLVDLVQPADPIELRCNFPISGTRYTVQIAPTHTVRELQMVLKLILEASLIREGETYYFSRT